MYYGNRKTRKRKTAGYLKHDAYFQIQLFF